jgi:hypothetical protein
MSGNAYMQLQSYSGTYIPGGGSQAFISQVHETSLDASLNLHNSKSLALKPSALDESFFEAEEKKTEQRQHDLYC